jgi:hypothetical protein
MAEHPERHLHPIRVLHALACLALACGFGWYGWRNHPVRKAFHAVSLARAHGVRSTRTSRGLYLPEAFKEQLLLLRAALPDVLGGLAVLGLFALGTGVYARRFEVWLEAHQAGEAATLRGVGLDQATLGANKDRKRGAVL